MCTAQKKSLYELLVQALGGNHLQEDKMAENLMEERDSTVLKTCFGIKPQEVKEGHNYSLIQWPHASMYLSAWEELLVNPIYIWHWYDRNFCIFNSWQSFLLQNETVALRWAFLSSITLALFHTSHPAPTQASIIYFHHTSEVILEC